jgi:hypothetical protein
LNYKLSDDFYLENLRLNPLGEMHPLRFKCPFEKWIQTGTLKGNVMDAIMLEIHYKFDWVDNMVTLLDVIDNETITSFL